MGDRPSRSRLAATVRVINLLLIGLLAGAMVEEYLLFSVVLIELPAAAWAGLHARFALVHPYTVIPVAGLGMATLAAIFVIERDVGSARARWTWLAAACGIAIGLLTASVMIPANDAIAAWAEHGIPPDHAEFRARWTTLQGLRAAASTLGFLALLIAAATRRPK